MTDPRNDFPSEDGPRQATTRQAGVTEEVTDAAITAGVKSKLAVDRDLDSSDITVATDNGAVTLTGSVSDGAARSAAETATRSFAGATNVNNRLSVASPSMGQAASSTGEAVMATGDAAAQVVSETWITAKVKSLLLADSDAKGLDVSVETMDGVVSLGGAVEDQTAIDHVKDIAAGVGGVKSVRTTSMTVTGKG